MQDYPESFEYIVISKLQVYLRGAKAFEYYRGMLRTLFPTKIL